jgi:hypothetical protein
MYGFKTKAGRLSIWTMALVLALASFFSLYGTAQAAQLTSRKLTLGSSVPSASTTYAFSMVLPSVTVVKSAEAVICTTASGACTTPSGFVNSSATLTGQPVNLGDASGWTVNSSTAGKLRLTKTGNVAAPTGTTTFSFSSVTNPSATNATFFARITTYSDDAWTTAIDTGNAASSTAGQITVTASVDETLTFTLTSATVALGTLSSVATNSGTSTMSASTNATSGYSITVNGTTLTSGANTIPALASATTSSVGTSQFGINLKDNATPNVGTDPSGGTGAASVANGYGTADNYKFVSGDVIAGATAATNATTYVVSYIANIGGAQAAGAYSTVLTYIATATF